MDITKKKKRGSDRNARRPDSQGRDQGIYKHNKALIRKTAERCAICGGLLDKSLRYPHPYSMTIDHIIPISRGGRSTMDNLQPAHLICNSRKGSRLEAAKHLEQSDKGTKEYGSGKKTLPQYFDWKNYDAAADDS